MVMYMIDSGAVNVIREWDQKCLYEIVRDKLVRDAVQYGTGYS